MLILYRRERLFAPVLRHHSISVVFVFPGMIFATMFVMLPFVARELIQILEE